VAPHVTLEIPIDLVDTVISALYRSADLYRADKGHDAEGVAVLVESADRLEVMAELLEDSARGSSESRAALRAARAKEQP
jgi:hypothetical protein